MIDRIKKIYKKSIFVVKNRFPVFQNHVNFGDLHRLKPFSDKYGADRGQVIDRYYIDQFLSVYQERITGNVLELRDRYYSEKFGQQIAKSEILDKDAENKSATIVADLTGKTAIELDSFDCIILTQTLQFIYDYRAALREIYRILKPGGIVLATLPTITPAITEDKEKYGEYWRFTSMSAKNIFLEFFDESQVKIHSYGNVLSAAAFLYGLPAESLKKMEIDYFDPKYECLIGVAAIK